MNRLVLGTAQLGMSYGINNKAGKPDLNAARDIVRAALDNGITRFDTAQAYGESEGVLGKIFHEIKASDHIKVYSKLRPDLDLSDGKAVRASVDDSLRRLKINRLEGLLLHCEEGLKLWNDGLGDSLTELVVAKKVKSIGVSFYTPKKALEALDIYGIDLIQVPANILDRRFEDAGVFKKAGEFGKNVFVRSIFLQGLLLMPSNSVPAKMRNVLPYLERLEQMASDMKLSRQELVLGYAAGKWPDVFVLFGAESKQQVIDNAKVFAAKKIPEIDEAVFGNVPENVLNPVLWSKS
ncbi:MAG: aldo/keto reductase [Candidatus Omnitrophica bacterium]|nr:aldo/keto reductase [Candidatus Omnitrophota bacterium]